MGNARFSSPLYIRWGKHLVYEIATLADAIDFLSEWPDERRDIIHETALRACIEVHDGIKPLGVARGAIEGFARRTGILEEHATPLPRSGDPPPISDKAGGRSECPRTGGE